VAILNGGVLVCGVFPEATVRTIYGENPDVLIAASFNERNSRAEPAAGGYRVNGRWPFVSGCTHADWLHLGCTLTVNGEPQLDAAGRPRVRRVLLHRDQVEILDTWHVGGLRGTGSHDVVVRDVVVSEEYSVPVPAPPTRPGTLWSFPPTSQLGLNFVSVGLGLARTAIETVKDLAGAKRPHRATGLLRERVPVQVDIARAEVLLESARGYLHGRVAAIWEATERGEAVSLEQRALLRAAVVNAAESAARVVDLMYTAGGATSVYETCPLERCFRDVHTLTQQIMLSPQHWESAGRVLLGLEPGSVPL
jgi:alkylation response protein AidB-like acyl-CoA dehydrogenase